MTELNREAVERRLARLRETYDPPVLAVEERVPGERFERLAEPAREGYTGGAYAWTVRSPEEAPPPSESMPPEAGPNDDHVLLILNRGADATLWSLPGGGREGEETSEETARREVREETGIEVEVGEPFQVLRVRTTPHDGGTTAHTLWVHFDARYVDGRLDPQASELRGAAWFVEPPGDLETAAARRGAEFWPSYDPPDEAVSLGPEDDPNVTVEVRESPEGD